MMIIKCDGNLILINMHIQFTILQPKYSENMRQQKIAESVLSWGRVDNYIIDWILASFNCFERAIEWDGISPI